MALTFTKNHASVVGDKRVWRGTITFDSSYPTGGEAVTAANFGFNVDIQHVNLGSVDDAKYHAAWDATNSKIILYVEDGTSGIEAQAANESDQSAVIVTLEAFGA
jgi:hypothetical protein